MDTLRYDTTDGSAFDVATIPGYVTTVRVCVDCHYAIHGVENGTPDPRWPGMTPQGRVVITDAHTWYDADHGQAMAEPSFGWSPCGTCGTHVGGDRFAMDVLTV